MRNPRKIPFVAVPTETLGQLFMSAIGYALRSDEQCLIEKVSALLCEYFNEDSIPAPMCDVIIRNIRSRHEFGHGSPMQRYDDLWIKLLGVLTEPPDLHCAPHGAPSGKIVHLKQNELVALLSSALQYALGRHTYIVGAMCDWIHDFAPKIHSYDRASLASDIRCYLEKPRPDEKKWHEDSWRETLAFINSLNRPKRTHSPKPRR